jgi:hypothetical protein
MSRVPEVRWSARRKEPVVLPPPPPLPLSSLCCAQPGCNVARRSGHTERGAPGRWT